MKVIVGLGNPGSQYSKTRHNAGFMVIDRLVRRHAPAVPVRARHGADTIEASIGAERVMLVKPVTYMNRSGQSVGEVARFYKIDPVAELLVIVDEIYLPVGTIRLRPGGGTSGHNGLADIDRALGRSDYPRLRIGVGPKPDFFDQSDFVLGRFTPDEEPLVEPSLDRAADAAELFATRGLNAAMNRFNAKDDPGADRQRSPGRGPDAPARRADQKPPTDIHPGWLSGEPRPEDPTP